MGGVIASSDPRAARVGADVLRAGGNAVDAAVAAVFVLYVVEPHACGPGGDAFLMIGEPGAAPEGLDGSGAVPAGLTQEALTAAGLETVPIRGGATVTVPGAVSLLEEALGRYGTTALTDAIAPAVDLARNGFAARRTLAETAARAASSIANDPVLGPLYAPDGSPVAIDQQITNPRLADLLERIAAEGAGVLYQGPVAEAIVGRVAEAGGYLTLEDMAAHRTEPVAPLSATFRGRRVWELPAPTQGPAVTIALERLEPLAEIGWDDVVEAVAAGLQGAGIPVKATGAAPARAAPRDTTYVAVMDGDGRAASMITTVFADFGAHVGVAELGGPVQNRATMFTALRRPPQPGKPPHTTIPAVVTHDGTPEYALGLAGGFTQAQVQVQLLLRLLTEGMDPQAAIDAPRFKLELGGGLTLEPGHPLAERHPDAVKPTGPEGFGAAQIAARLDGGFVGGADARRDGVVVTI